MMVGLAVGEGDIARAESLAMRQHGGIGYADSAWIAVARGDSVTANRLLKAAPGAKPSSLIAAAFGILAMVGEPVAAEPFAREAIAHVPGPGRGVPLALDLAVQGRWTTADSLLSVMAVESQGPRLIALRGLVAAPPFLGAPRERLQALRSTLTDWNPDAREPGSQDLTLVPQVRLYLLGLLASRLDEPQEALRKAGELEAAAVNAEYRYIARSLAATVRADVALSAGRAGEALKYLESVRGMLPLDARGATPLTEEHARYLRAEALVALGRDDDALAWYANGFDGPDVISFLYRAPASRRMAEIYVRKGEREKAVAAYSRFLRMWAHCDAALQPELADARARLARLEGDPAPRR